MRVCVFACACVYVNTIVALLATVDVVSERETRSKVPIRKDREKKKKKKRTTYC